jgi:hypothetical protein
MKTPGFTVRLAVKFGVDKRGRNIAWAKSPNRAFGAWVRVNYDQARMWVAGDYVNVHEI